MILGVEALCAAQGVDFRAPLTHQPGVAGRASPASARRSRRSTATATSPPTSPRAAALVADGALTRGLDLPDARGRAVTP